MSTPAGYSGTPLPRKLGIREGSVVRLVGAPDGFELPVPLDAGPPFDVALWFPADRAAFEAGLADLRAAMTPAAGLWVCWPKKAALRTRPELATGVDEDVIRAVALPTGLVDNKVCAVDATWSALRLVIRRELRG
ncbi:hypothetical protein GCM10009665_36580 [Kitasatospora nipponensis]|uniref:DUF3052 family protein n=1 Tax=Kitasatospora nipponensis TaxID=258049 RepID=A0ABN1WA44_9ACTN